MQHIGGDVFCVWCLTARCTLIIAEPEPPHETITSNCSAVWEGGAIKWNITFRFYLRRQHAAPNQSGPRKPTLDLFHLNMTTIISPKIRRTSLLFRSDGGVGGGQGTGLFKDKCSSVHDPCGNHTPPAERGGGTCLHECTCAHKRLRVNGFRWIVRCWSRTVLAR